MASPAFSEPKHRLNCFQNKSEKQSKSYGFGSRLLQNWYTSVFKDLTRVRHVFLLFFGHSKIKVRSCVICVYAGTPLTAAKLTCPFNTLPTLYSFAREVTLVLWLTASHTRVARAKQVSCLLHWLSVFKLAVPLKFRFTKPLKLQNCFNSQTKNSFYNLDIYNKIF